MKLAKFSALILALALFLPSCSAGLVAEEDEVKKESTTTVSEETEDKTSENKKEDQKVDTPSIIFPKIIPKI